jgi:hypothetical protein
MCAQNAWYVLVWVLSLGVWNLLSCSISVDGLSFYHIKSGASDSIKFKYNETKADKTGEFMQEKTCYENPLKPHL